MCRSVLASRQDLEDAPGRRAFLYAVTGLFAAVGLSLATWPLAASLGPSAEQLVTRAVDVSDIAPGERRTVYWKGYPVFIAHRTAEEIELARADEQIAVWSRLHDHTRVQRDEWLVVIGLSYWRGCWSSKLSGQKPGDDRGKLGGWYSSCNGESYDLSGRSSWYLNDLYGHLYVPPYRFLSDTEIEFPACFPSSYLC